MVQVLGEFSKRETQNLDALQIGLRISRDNMGTLFEECDHCRKQFMQSALCVHIRQVAETMTNSDEVV